MMESRSNQLIVNGIVTSTMPIEQDLRILLNSSIYGNKLIVLGIFNTCIEPYKQKMIHVKQSIFTNNTYLIFIKEEKTHKLIYSWKCNLSCSVSITKRFS